MAITATDLHAAFVRIANAAQVARDELCEADGRIGDGDLGLTVADGFAACAALDLPEDIGQALFHASKAFQQATVLTEAEEAAVVAFRRHTLLPLDDCLYALQPSIPHLTRSALHRCLQRHGISRLPDVEGGRVCREHGIEHRLTKVRHPWTNGQVEWMNRTIKEATVKRFHYDNHDQLRTHLDDFIAAYNFARRLKTLSGLTPYEYICKVWTSEPDRFIVDPIHQMPGLNT